MARTRESVKHAIALQATLEQLEDSLSVTMGHELKELREICKDPLVFLETMAPSIPEKRVSFETWTFLCSLMNWDSPQNFQNSDEYHAFLDSIVHAGSDDKPSRVPTPVPVSASPSAGTVVTSEPIIGSTPLEGDTADESSVAAKLFPEAEVPVASGSGGDPQ
jgi:hypothetical protein